LVSSSPFGLLVWLKAKEAAATVSKAMIIGRFMFEVPFLSG
jgi:hypothetical protein